MSPQDTLQLYGSECAVIATAARAVNAIDAVCHAPAGILAAHDLRPLDHLRGVMW